MLCHRSPKINHVFLQFSIELCCWYRCCCVRCFFCFFFLAQIMNCIVCAVRRAPSFFARLTLAKAYFCLNKAPQNVQKCIWICIIVRMQEIKSSCSYINMNVLCAQRKSTEFVGFFFGLLFVLCMKESQYTDICVTFLRQFFFWSGAITIPNKKKTNKNKQRILSSLPSYKIFFYFCFYLKQNKNKMIRSTLKLN